MRHVLLPSDVEATLRDRGIEPDEKYTAVAGKDYGYVDAWQLADGDYLIAYGNNAETYHAIADNVDDLAHWLEDPDLSGLDAILQKANIRGVESIREANADACGPFYVLKTRHYGPIEKTEVVLFERCYEDARKWIQSKENGGYIAAYDESSAPTYTIVAVPE